MLSFPPRNVLDDIWDLVESVSEGFPSYSCTRHRMKLKKRLRESFLLILYRKLCTDDVKNTNKKTKQKYILCIRKEL